MPKHNLAAVIEVGSSDIRFIVAELTKKGEWKIIDRASKPASIGRDVFTGGFISRSTIFQSLKVIRQFKELIKGWQIHKDDIRIIATSAVREAKNRDAFIDRVEVRTGYRISVIDGIEENRLTFVAVQHALQGMKQGLSRGNSLILDVGGGSTEVILLRRGKIVAIHSLGIGTVKIEQRIRMLSGGAKGSLVRYLKENISTMRELLDAEMKLKGIRNFIMIGSSARIIAEKEASQNLPAYSVINRKDYTRKVKELQKMNIDECASSMDIPYDDAEGLATTLSIFQFFLDGTSAEEVIVPKVTTVYGLLLGMNEETNSIIQEKFYNQVLASAYSLGKKYHFDGNHAQHVAYLSLKLFDLLVEEHGLNTQDRMLLEVAAILHDIGFYIRQSGHHKHGQYIIANSEIFGLDQRDIGIISNVARYHRKGMPNPSHSAYYALSREDRIRVLKLASLLRIADALDRGHTQRIPDFVIDRSEEEIVLDCTYDGDISVERFSLPVKASMFEEVFGMKVSLK